jgi:hypothetical protein
LNLVKRINVVSPKNENKKDNDDQKLKLIREFNDVFSDDITQPSNMEEKIELDVSKNAIPVVEPPRRIPHVLYNKLKNTLDRYEQQNIVSQVPQPSEWVHNLVIIEKADGSLRLCLDPGNLNKYIICDYQLIPKARGVNE